ncbi:MAG: Lamin globular tail-like protein [Candidatus Adlerbacteria bacterium]|nr:Lamin globular tail-like protein [Candidatus Adlerbacteria bacterium]
MKATWSRSALVLLVICAPFSVQASVVITEVMYDPSGSDTGREWIEVTNTGSSAVDISDYKLFEANINHGLTILTGSANLAAGASAILIGDQAKFGADYTNFSGTLIKASFSLSNTGEALAIKDGDLSVVDSTSYDPAVGAGGDGNSLARSGSIFVAGTPTPGSYGAVQVEQQTSQTQTATQATQTTQATTQTTQTETSVNSGNTPPPLGAEITTNSQALVGAGTSFTGHAYDASDKPFTNARYIWNFGDGATAEGQTVLHTYMYPGSYVVVLDVAHGYSSGEATYTISAVPADIALVAQPDNSLVVINHWSKSLDIGGWILMCPGGGIDNTFIIPKRTNVLGGGGVRFSGLVTKLSCNTQSTLMYPNGTLAAQAELSDDAPEHGEAMAPVAVAALKKGVAKLVAAPARTAPGSVPAHTSAKSVSNTSTTSTSSQMAAVSQSRAGLPVSESVLGLVALIILGIAGARFVSHKNMGHTLAGEKQETSSYNEEFEIE